MAIYPLKNNKVVNYDVLRFNTFTSGMVLSYDGGAYDATNLTNSYNLRIAEWQNASSSGSYVAAARIFNRALSESEIRQNVNSTMSRLIIKNN